VTFVLWQVFGSIVKTAMLTIPSTVSMIRFLIIAIALPEIIARAFLPTG